MLVSLMVFLVSLRLCSFFSLCSSDIMISIFVYVDLFSASLNLWLWSSSEFFIPVILLFMPGSLITPQRTPPEVGPVAGAEVYCDPLVGRTYGGLAAGGQVAHSSLAASPCGWSSVCVGYVCPIRTAIQGRPSACCTPQCGSSATQSWGIWGLPMFIGLLNLLRRGLLSQGAGEMATVTWLPSPVDQLSHNLSCSGKGDCAILPLFLLQLPNCC